MAFIWKNGDRWTNALPTLLHKRLEPKCWKTAPTGWSLGSINVDPYIYVGVNWWRSPSIACAFQNSNSIQRATLPRTVERRGVTNMQKQYFSQIQQLQRYIVCLSAELRHQNYRRDYRNMHEPPSTRVGINRQTSFEYVVGCGWTLLSNRRNNTGHPGPNNCGEELSARKRGDTLQEVQFCGRDDLPMLNQRSP